MTRKTFATGTGAMMLGVMLGLGVVAPEVFGPTPAAAQPMTEILRRTGLKQGDINLMTRTAATLYQGASHKVGSEADWSNPDTGASGKAMLVGFAKDCADIRHVVITQRRPEPQEFTLRNCKTATGTWVLSP